LTNFKEALENAIDDIYDTHSIITGDNGGKSFIPGKLETSWIDELTDYADTFLEDDLYFLLASFRQKLL
jgi:hypothetical protein